MIWLIYEKVTNTSSRATDVCSSGYDSEDECFLEETIDNLNDNEIFEKVCELKRDNNK